MAACDDCSRRFRTSDALEDHKRDTRHCFCHRCDRLFRTVQGLEDHRDSLHNYCCPDCNKRFDFNPALEQHQRSTGHAYCDICEKCFEHKDSVNNHRRALHSPDCRNRTTPSRSRIVAKGWGDRHNFQASYGLQMTPEDLEEGDAILKAMQEADRHW
ncbi:uncharacterized protein LY89DRAFT_686305 [Mollisia scopiformis]|uniref:C2H2-type domain-containing protein n=1 Tax=Mollisia scopiformis TaxID=149040 RepID=A0A194X470_MOLSC|nr:uncharacterized protein LY89DRAFT_686305 [Mollisia scopiformis]KUJ14612.1 hypothetical protein LY89DRAFT_686305 [Mollisia scopiformis]